jgi:hypothetical protein
MARNLLGARTHIAREGIDTSNATGRMVAGVRQPRHAKPTTTQDVYMARGKVDTKVADALDDAINDA